MVNGVIDHQWWTLHRFNVHWGRTSPSLILRCGMIDVSLTKYPAGFGLGPVPTQSSICLPRLLWSRFHWNILCFLWGNFLNSSFLKVPYYTYLHALMLKNTHIIFCNFCLKCSVLAPESLSPPPLLKKPSLIWLVSNCGSFASALSESLLRHCSREMTVTAL